MNSYGYKYQFKREDAFGIASHLSMKAQEKGSELQFLWCPYCHGNGKDRGTFSINLSSGTFKCLRASCGQQGHVYQLAKDFDYKLTDDFSRYYQKKETYRKLPQPKVKVEPKPEAIEYLASRGISEGTARAYQITVKNDDPTILCFPVFNADGKLVNIKYRNTKYVKGESKGNKEWFESGCEPYLYGVQAFDGDYSRFILTEGQMDALACYEAGIKNAFAVLGGKNAFTWFPACYDFISKFDELIVFGDFEHGNITLLDDMKIRFKKKVRHVRFEDYQDCKDANDILLKYGKEQIHKCIDNAQFMPMDNVIELADVEDVDIFKLQKMKTGVSQIDRLLYGGLPFGGVSIVSGCAGEGKSTLTSQMIVNALSQGYKCFCYSGELPNYLFKQWMSFQVAGASHIFEYSNKWGDKQYGLSEANKAMISNWYRGKIILYDNASLDGDEKETLCETIEKVIIQYGTEVILLDNLMTAISLENNIGANELEVQTNLLKKLTRIAVRFNVLIILVAHKRKNQTSTNENHEIMGSSNVVNLAMLTISYGKASDIEPGQRICKISKNRLFGKTDTEGFVLNYDEKSKRIYGKGDNVNVDYGFDYDYEAEISNKVKFDIEIEDEETPFR